MVNIKFTGRNLYILYFVHVDINNFKEIGKHSFKIIHQYIKKKTKKQLIYFYVCSASMYVCAPYVCLVPM